MLENIGLSDSLPDLDFDFQGNIEERKKIGYLKIKNLCLIIM